MKGVEVGVRGNGDGGQTFAVIEALITQTRYGIGNGNGGQICAITEFVSNCDTDI